MLRLRQDDRLGLSSTRAEAASSIGTNRPVETLEPLSAALNMTIDTSYGRDDVDDLVAGIADLDGDAVAVVCWEHSVLTDIATALGVDDAPEYPSSEYDWQWTVRRGELVQDNEDC